MVLFSSPLARWLAAGCAIVVLSSCSHEQGGLNGIYLHVDPVGNVVTYYTLRTYKEGSKGAVSGIESTMRYVGSEHVVLQGAVTGDIDAASREVVLSESSIEDVSRPKFLNGITPADERPSPPAIVAVGRLTDDGFVLQGFDAQRRATNERFKRVNGDDLKKAVAALRAR